VKGRGFVLEVDERTPPLLVHNGEGFRLETFPLNTRVVYPPPPLPGVADLDAAIQRALLYPCDSDPLPARLRPGMRLTIAFDDISLPLPPMREPDIRGRILEHVLQMAACAGVDDVVLLVANSLHRRMTPDEIKRSVGERVYRSFWPEALRNHDAEDPHGLTFIGCTDHGEEIEINRRAAESDLLIYVNINLVAMDGGHKSVPVGLGSYRSLKHHHNVPTLLASRSYMDPHHSALHASCNRMGRVLSRDLEIFTIETTLNNAMFPHAFDFLNKREWEWNVQDQATALASMHGLAAAPRRVRRHVLQNIQAPYAVTGVTAGETEAVHRSTLASLHRQQVVDVQGQSDVLVCGVPYICPYNVNSVMNPLLVYSTALGYFFNMYRGAPLVRKGGVLIVFHPVTPEFHPVHHPSYTDFYEEVLANTTDPATIERKYEERYARDPWYVHLYRTSYAYHGVHPFYMWYWGAHAREYLGEVILVGGDRQAVGRLGFRAASTFGDALEIARDAAGPRPSITYFHAPPLMLADVTR
jgi:lactate racemase